MHIQHQRRAARMGEVMETQVKRCKGNRKRQDTIRELLDCILEPISIPPPLLGVCIYMQSQYFFDTCHCIVKLCQLCPQSSFTAPCWALRSSAAPMISSDNVEIRVSFYSPVPFERLLYVTGGSRNSYFCSNSRCLSLGRSAKGTKPRTVSISLYFTAYMPVKGRFFSTSNFGLNGLC